MEIIDSAMIEEEYTPGLTLKQAFSQEEIVKERVYCHLEQSVQGDLVKVNRAERTVERGSYESQDSFVVNNEKHVAYEDLALSKRIEAALLPKPYIAHIELTDEYDEQHCFLLSDSAHLDSAIPLDDGETLLIPFRLDQKRPIQADLFRIATRKGFGLQSFTSQGISYKVSLHRDVDIRNRKLKQITQHYPPLADRSNTVADDMLTKLLDEHREDVRLRNIIATLQAAQFEIIDTDADVSFIVQGCAGSGKTQCMIHRLFYLRSVLQDRGWEKVLLLTPSQLFQNYSYELMIRYQLVGLRQTSITELYQQLLAVFDPRFKNRQYAIELTEEYLPDGYLEHVYRQDSIIWIENEISSAIERYVSDARQLLNLEVTETGIDARQVLALVKLLDEAIHDYDQRSQELSGNKDYQTEMLALEEEDKQRAALIKRRTALDERKINLKDEWDQYQSTLDTLKEAEERTESWEEEWQQRLRTLQRGLIDIVDSFSGVERIPLSMLAEYRRAIHAVLDMQLPSGVQYQNDATTRQYLEGLCSLARKKLSEFLKNEPERKWAHRWKDRMDNCNRQYDEVQGKIQTLTYSIERRRERIQSLLNDQETAQTRMKSHRAALERSRFYLSRLESSVFEHEVWNALAPTKEKYGIQTIHITQRDQGGQMQTRILYKADLLFYLMIYMHLYKPDVLPDYRMICIDEGQDLHSADYTMLHSLFPNATFNVFGDTAQSLHESCGITDWRRQTGINNLFVLDTNYRNTPEVVDFCNRSFRQSMKYVGRPANYARLIKCTNKEMLCAAVEQDNCVIIVKDQDALNAFCRISGMARNRFLLLDTTADSSETNLSLCYTVFAAKGLEFSRVLVFPKGMTQNQKTTACTRAIGVLYYYEG